MTRMIEFLNEQALICDPHLRVDDLDFEPLQLAFIHYSGHRGAGGSDSAMERADSL
jgi:hypothetical protein